MSENKKSKQRFSVYNLDDNLIDDEILKLKNEYNNVVKDNKKRLKASRNKFKNAYEKKEKEVEKLRIKDAFELQIDIDCIFKYYFNKEKSPSNASYFICDMLINMFDNEKLCTFTGDSLVNYFKDKLNEFENNSTEAKREVDNFIAKTREGSTYVSEKKEEKKRIDFPKNLYSDLIDMLFEIRLGNSITDKDKEVSEQVIELLTDSSITDCEQTDKQSASLSAEKDANELPINFHNNKN